MRHILPGGISSFIHSFIHTYKEISIMSAEAPLQLATLAKALNRHSPDLSRRGR
jgi:hypothetical protein